MTGIGCRSCLKAKRSTLSFILRETARPYCGNASIMIKIEPGWKAALEDEFDKEYFTKLSGFVRGEYSHAIVYPPPKNIFRAFDLCPFDKVKVVILGQDPYHGAGQANGLCF